MDNEKLIEKELEQVGGGNGNSVSNWGDIKPKYCKYCMQITPQILKGSGSGWERGHCWPCHLWECTVCKQTNYWRLKDGKEDRILI